MDHELEYSYDKQLTKRRNFVPKEIKRTLYDEQEGKCMYCGRKLPFGNMVANHKTPTNRNGPNTINNIQILCPSCNSRKGRLTDPKFRDAYKLQSVKDTKAMPPSEIIPIKHFEEITKQRTKRRRIKYRNAKIRSRSGTLEEA